LPPNTDLLFYEGLHGAVVTDDVNVARYADLKIGVVPVINLEWTQKLLRDRQSRATPPKRSPRRSFAGCMITSTTSVRNSRKPTSISSARRPWTLPIPCRPLDSHARRIHRGDRFRDPKGVDFPYLVTMNRRQLDVARQFIVIPGNKLDLAMQLILTPRILDLVRRRKSVG